MQCLRPEDRYGNNLSAQPKRTVWKYCKMSESMNSPPCCASLACISIVHGVGSSVIVCVLCQKLGEHNVSFIPANTHIACTILQQLKYTNRHFAHMRYFITWLPEVADGSKILKEFTENMDQEIFNDSFQFVRCDCVGENSYLIHSSSISTPTS
jgi:hypothetical protein